MTFVLLVAVELLVGLIDALPLGRNRTQFYRIVGVPEKDEIETLTTVSVNRILLYMRIAYMSDDAPKG